MTASGWKESGTFGQKVALQVSAQTGPRAADVVVFVDRWSLYRHDNYDK